MSSGEIFSSHEGEQSGEATRSTYGERGRKVVESISLSELAAIDIKSLSDQELEDLNNRLKADIEAGYARLGITPTEAAPEPAPAPAPEPEPAPETPAETPEAVSGDTATDGQVDVVPGGTTPEEILGETPMPAPAPAPGPAPEPAPAPVPEPAPAPAPESAPAPVPEPTSEAPAPTPEAAPTSPETERAAATRDKVKKDSRAKKALRFIAGMAVGAILATTIGGNFDTFGHNNKDDAQNPTPLKQYEHVIDDEVTPMAGELSNGVHYDYNEYADYENKTSEYAFGYDKSDCYGDRDATIEAWMEMADKSPEYLSAYATNLFTEEEKAELGIDGMSPAELDNYLSNAKNIDGGEKQQKIMDKLQEIANDENTTYNFYHENDTEKSYYIVFNDANGDGNYTPDELSLGYSVVPRHGAPQVDVSRVINGEKIKLLDLNMQCGFQPNQETQPDLPLIPDNPDTGSENTGEETTGSEDTGEETTGSEDTGEETTGSEDTGEETTGSEDTGEETTGSEDTGEETTGSEDTGEETTGSEDTGEETTGDEGTDINPKDPENYERIEENTDEDLAGDTGSDDLDKIPTPTEEVESQTPSEQASDSDYQGTEATTTQNDTSTQAEPVKEQTSPENNYSNDNGGAHQSEPAPVQSKPDPTPAPAPQPEPQTSHEAEDSLDDLNIE